MRKTVKRKSYYLYEAAIEQARHILGTKTETETIQKALELVADEARLARALKHLLNRGKGHIHDPGSEGQEDKKWSTISAEAASRFWEEE